MTISINWGTKVISVPKADLTLIQSDPTEIRELNLDTFRLWLKDIEDSEEGMPHLDTHRHNTEVSLGGIVLARVVEIINGYTVTFEDGQYAVNLVGANSNVGDNVNVNQVSVRSFNSAGLTSSPAIEFASFEGGVWIDVTSSTVGTVYPSGTHLAPVNNVADAEIICAVRGFELFYIIGNITFGATDNIDDHIIIGESASKSTVTITSGCSTEGAEFSQMVLVGTLNGSTFIDKCYLAAGVDLNGVQGWLNQTIIGGDITLAGSGVVHFTHCYSGVPGGGTPTIDMGGSGRGLSIRAFAGELKLTNKSGSELVSLDFISGQAIIDSTVTNGEIIVRGVAKVIDNSTGSAVVDISNLVNPFTIADQTWAEAVADHLVAGSFGEAINLIRQVNGGKLVIDPTTSTVTIYAANDVDILKVYDIKKLDGQPAGQEPVYQRIPQ